MSSTLLAHISIHDFVTRQLDVPSTHGVALVAFDLKKAFDSLSHLCLLNTLSRLNLPSSFLKWIQSFLQDRSQVVFFNGFMSSSIVPVTSGVPQGAILAPYLFAAHMGSLSPSSNKAKMIKYADDVTVLLPFRKSDSIAEAVETETRNIRDWCLQNGLTLNEEKTKVLLFSKQRIDEELLTGMPALVSSAKILGVTFNSRLNWKDHVTEITKSASRRIYVLKELKKIDSITKKDLLQVYQGFILSVLEYNSALFTSMTAENKETLEKLRRRCHRIICSRDCGCSDFPSLNDRRYEQTLKVFTNMFTQNHILHHLLPHKLPRTQQFFIEHLRSELRARSFIPFCCIRWNSILKKWLCALLTCITRVFSPFRAFSIAFCFLPCSCSLYNDDVFYFCNLWFPFQRNKRFIIILLLWLKGVSVEHDRIWKISLRSYALQNWLTIDPPLTACPLQWPQSERTSFFIHLLLSVKSKLLSDHPA